MSAGIMIWWAIAISVGTAGLGKFAFKLGKWASRFDKADEVFDESGKAVDLSLKYKRGWTDAQKAAADAKCAALCDANTIVTKVERQGTSAASRYRSAGNTVESGYDVDHVVDLQLGGLDVDKAGLTKGGRFVGTAAVNAVSGTLSAGVAQAIDDDNGFSMESIIASSIAQGIGGVYGEHLQQPKADSKLAQAAYENTQKSSGYSDPLILDNESYANGRKATLQRLNALETARAYGFASAEDYAAGIAQVEADSKQAIAQRAAQSQTAQSIDEHAYSLQLAPTSMGFGMGLGGSISLAAPAALSGVGRAAGGTLGQTAGAFL